MIFVFIYLFIRSFLLMCNSMKLYLWTSVKELHLLILSEKTFNTGRARFGIQYDEFNSGKSIFIETNEEIDAMLFVMFP